MHRLFIYFSLLFFRMLAAFPSYRNQHTHTIVQTNQLQFPLAEQIKEGAEKLREVATDRRSLSDVASIVKKSNNKLVELQSELNELESQILLTKGNSVSNGQGE